MTLGSPPRPGVIALSAMAAWEAAAGEALPHTATVFSEAQ